MTTAGAGANASAALSAAIITPASFQAEGWSGWAPSADDVLWDHAPLQGKWRRVYACRLPDGRVGMLKLLRRRPFERSSALAPLRPVLARLRSSENDREWCTLQQVGHLPALAEHFPAPIGRGTLNGRDAIVVTRASVGGNITSLRQHVHQFGADQGLRDKLESIRDGMCEHHVQCNDVSMRNIAMDDEPTGEPRPVVIDGFGNNHLIPYTRVSRQLNATKLRRRFDRIMQQVERAHDAYLQGRSRPMKSAA